MVGLLDCILKSGGASLRQANAILEDQEEIRLDTDNITYLYSDDMRS